MPCEKADRQNKALFGVTLMNLGLVVTHSRLWLLMESTRHCSSLLRCSTLGRRDSDSSGGMMRRGSHTTPVAAIQEGILDNGAIGASCPARTNLLP